MEIIKHAAIMVYDGQRVFTGKSHAHCIHKAIADGVRLTNSTSKQGFLTSTGRFVDREDAAKIAHKSGQIRNCPYALFSEDLWSDVCGGLCEYDDEKGYLLKKD
jgi:hypothetical protein